MSHGICQYHFVSPRCHDNAIVELEILWPIQDRLSQGLRSSMPSRHRILWSALVKLQVYNDAISQVIYDMLYQTKQICTPACPAHPCKLFSAGFRMCEHSQRASQSFCISTCICAAYRSMQYAEQVGLPEMTDLMLAAMVDRNL